MSTYSIKQGTPSSSEGGSGSTTIRWVNNSLYLFVKYNGKWHSTPLSDKAISLADTLSITTVNMGAQVFTSMNTAVLNVTESFDVSSVQPSSFSLPQNSISYDKLKDDAQRWQVEDASTSAWITTEGGSTSLQVLGTANEATVSLNAGSRILTIGLPNDVDITASLDVGTAFSAGTTGSIGTNLTVGDKLAVNTSIQSEEFYVSGDAWITGDLTTGGTVSMNNGAVTINSGDTFIEDHKIHLNYAASNPGSETDADANEGGLRLHKASATEADFLWMNATNSWTSNQGLVVTDALYVDVDGYANRVGINKAAPTTALDIVGNSNEGGILYTGADGANSILKAVTTNRGGIDFYTESNTVEPYNRFVFESGMVGIFQSTTTGTLRTALTVVKDATNEFTQETDAIRIKGNSGATNYRSAIGWSDGNHSRLYNAIQIGYVGESSSGAGEGGFYIATRSTTSDESPAERVRVDSIGYTGLNVKDPDTRLEIMENTTQLKLSHDDTYYTTLGTDSDGFLTINPSGNTVRFKDTVVNVQNENYTSSIFTGSGWSISKAGGRYDLEIDNLWVRGSMYVWELVINQIRATNGSLVVTSAAKLSDMPYSGATVLNVGTNYTMIFECGDETSVEQHPFADDDLVIGKTAEAGDATGGGAALREVRLTVTDHDVDHTNVNYCQVKIDSITAGTTVADIIGMTFCRLGSTSDPVRQGGVYLTSEDSKSPFIDIWNEVSSWAGWDAVGKVKTRIGRLDGVTSLTNDYGLFAGDKSTYKYIVAGSQSGVKLSDSEHRYIKASGTGIEFYDDIGSVAKKKMSIGSGNILMFADDGTTRIGDWDNDTLVLGRADGPNVYITPSAVYIRQSSTSYITLNNDGTGSFAGAITVGGTPLDTTTELAAGANQDSTADIRSGTSAADVGLELVDNVSQSTIQTDTLAAATATDVGLENVDNVSQATIQADTLSAATAEDVGLGNVTDGADITGENTAADASNYTGAIIGSGYTEADVNPSDTEIDSIMGWSQRPQSGANYYELPFTDNSSTWDNVANDYQPQAMTSGTAGPVTIGTDRLYQGNNNFGGSDCGFYIDSAGNFSLKNHLIVDANGLSVYGGGTFSGNLSGARGTFYGSLIGYAGVTDEDIGLALVNDNNGWNVLQMSGANSRICMGGTHDGDGTFTVSSAAQTSIFTICGNSGASIIHHKMVDYAGSADYYVGGYRDGDYNYFQMGFNLDMVSDRFFRAYPYSGLYLGYSGDWVRTSSGCLGFNGNFYGDLVGETTEAYDIDPHTSDSFSLGSFTKRWNTIYGNALVAYDGDVDGTYGVSYYRNFYGYGYMSINGYSGYSGYSLGLRCNQGGFTNYFVGCVGYSNGYFRLGVEYGDQSPDTEYYSVSVQHASYAASSGTSSSCSGTADTATNWYGGSGVSATIGSLSIDGTSLSRILIWQDGDFPSSGADTSTAGLMITSPAGGNGSAWWHVTSDWGNDLGLYHTNAGRGGYVKQDDWEGQLTFTGQHRNYSVREVGEYDDKIGYIVCANGEHLNMPYEVNASNHDEETEQFYSTDIIVNEALPIVDLSTKAKDKTVFGVISDYEDPNNDRRVFKSAGNFVSVWPKDIEGDERLIVNSVGEGAVWVSNYNGDFENGDYITTSPLEGLGMKQDDDLLHNYTLGKITQDCKFDEDMTYTEVIEFEENGKTYKRAFVGCTYHCG